MEHPEFLDICIKLFETVRGTCLLFVPVVFLMRAGFFTITGSKMEMTSGLIKGTVLFFALSYGFESILKLLLELPESFLPGFSLEDRLGKKALVIEEAGSVSLEAAPIYLRWVLEALLAIIFHIANFFYLFVLLILSAIAPIIFFLSCLLSVGPGLSFFFGLLVLSSTWPIIWYGLETLSRWYSGFGVGGLEDLVFELIILVMRILGPLSVAFFATQSGPASMALGHVAGGIKALGLPPVKMAGAAAGKAAGAPFKEFRRTGVGQRAMKFSRKVKQSPNTASRAIYRKLRILKDEAPK